MTSRTTVYIEQEQLAALKERASSLDISVAELLRRLVREYLADGEPGVRPLPREAYAGIVGLGASGRQDVSDEHDRYLGEALAREHLR